MQNCQWRVSQNLTWWPLEQISDCTHIHGNLVNPLGGNSLAIKHYCVLLLLLRRMVL
jgi:hypothetical protein